ncbi:hypothetical protein C8F04DRAFT_1123792 [Mycena alexandri]|uniref:Bromo domain-containing protein n=1 Tax=Mycena alexandri TaxID=1745969 RepID=A0AAD6WVN8_9AGAR|nr:hypothetical protein C8F04DRAFT_1123792 [Mycena alexandri]
MDDSFDSDSQSESPPPYQPPLPKLTLLLPPLKDVKKSAKKSKSKSKSKSKQPFAYSEYPDASGSASQKIPRPVKLKPLKEVLGRLIVQLKKKDDYAFFLKPVNSAKVTGYADVVKRPMDLGTMTTKVQRGRYRSLEDFANDFRLVTSNAKIFNPPGSIYYTEADRLEVWGLDQISKASSTVIQYETDWNIEIEKDDAEDDAEDYAMAVDTAADAEERSRSPSVSIHGGGHPALLRRGPRGPYNKSSKDNPGAAVSESIDAEGRLPGSKDGLGAFPPGSDWARMMLALKLKGKRYKTKKERMRVEQHGPPYLSDGSLAYGEVEDPFSYLSTLVPDPQVRPQLIPIYPPPPQAFPLPTPRDTPSTPAPLGQPYPFPTLLHSPHPAPPPLPPFTKHWTLQRNGGPRRAKDDSFAPIAGDDPEDHAREPHALDFGSFAVLAAELAEEMRRRGSGLPAVLPEGLEDADALLKRAVRASVEVPPPEGEDDEGGSELPNAVFDPKEYWSPKNALDAEGYVRDVVYGGVDGLAYVRSLAEFVATPPLDVGAREEYEEDVDMESSPTLPLGSTLPSWVAHNVVGPLTEGRHALLQRTALELISPSAHSNSMKQDSDDADHDDKLPALVSAALHVRPRAAAALNALLQIHAHKIDMAALIRTPAELTQSEEEWAGKGLPQNGNGPAEMNVVLDYVAGVIARLQAEHESEREIKLEPKPESAVGGGGDEAESAVVRNLRLNLLALVKRAPLDTIARLPIDLVPEHIRPFVPTLTTVGT